MKIVDFHSHFFSRDYFTGLLKISPLSDQQEYFNRRMRDEGIELPPADPQDHLKKLMGEMDEALVDHIDGNGDQGLGALIQQRLAPHLPGHAGAQVAKGRMNSGEGSLQAGIIQHRIGGGMAQNRVSHGPNRTVSACRSRLDLSAMQATWSLRSHRRLGLSALDQHLPTIQAGGGCSS